MAGFWVRRMLSDAPTEVVTRPTNALREKVVAAAQATPVPPGLAQSPRQTDVDGAAAMSRAGSISSTEEFLARARRA
eukprot:symbB.v1.2.008462.t1/scaffold474.1/size199077/5